jgi:glutamyl-tRNA synthetase
MPNRIRVRFAPSPTGFLHIGNVRAALLNFIFARQRNGAFVLRIEDTDQARNIDEAGLKIINDLKWLNITYDEGPLFQSDRTNLYKQNLGDLISQQKVYRCFCTKEVLEKKRKDQLNSGQPPRYDRTCLCLSDDEIEKNISEKKPFIWRFKINQDQVITVKSMVRKELKFDMKNFSDFALTRADGSFTFLFANFVDDWLMEITHVIRGEDHISNTAMQAVLFDALAIQCPTFWHLPIICNKEGKKFSKRDFGFTIDDLKSEGFLAEAICNYLAIIGGTFQKEIQSLDELIHNFEFDNLHSTGAIKYDVEKLRWINHKWIERLDAKKLVSPIVSFLHNEIHASKEISEERLIYLIDKVKSDCKTLKDFVPSLRFCFEKPDVDIEKIDEYVGKNKTNLIAQLIDAVIAYVPQRDLFLETLKREGKDLHLKPKEFLGVVRYLLTGQFQGIGVHEILDMLDDHQILERLSDF